MVRIDKNSDTEESTVEPGVDTDARRPVAPWWVRHLNVGKPLSPELQAAIDDIVTPLYQRMVVSEQDPLLRCAGYAVVTTVTLELLQQPALLKVVKRANDEEEGAQEEYLKAIEMQLKLAAQRCKAMNLHLALRRAKYTPWQIPMDRHGIIHKCGHGI